MLNATWLTGLNGAIGVVSMASAIGLLYVQNRESKKRAALRSEGKLPPPVPGTRSIVGRRLWILVGSFILGGGLADWRIFGLLPWWSFVAVNVFMLMLLGSIFRPWKRKLVELTAPPLEANQDEAER